MKTKKLLISLFILPLSLNIALAQAPVLEANSINPSPGEQFIFLLDSTVSVSPGASGDSVTWNLSAMQGTASNVTVDSASSTPYHSFFDSANIAIVFDGMYQYYQTSASAMNWYGNVSVNGTDTSGTIYSVPIPFLRYPFTYDSSYTTVAITEIPNDSDCFHNRDTITITADGYGNLILPPADTFHNVLRVHCFENEHCDSSAYVAYRNEYFWYKNGYRFFIAYIRVPQFNNVGTGFCLSSTLTGIADQSNTLNLLHLFPNPASDYLNIRSSSLHPLEPLTISIMNVLGETIQEEKIKRHNDESINIKNLPAGIYFVQAASESGRWVGKFVKE